MELYGTGPHSHLGLGPWTPTLHYGPWAQPTCPKLNPRLVKAMGPCLTTLCPTQNLLSEPLQCMFIVAGNLRYARIGAWLTGDTIPRLHWYCPGKYICRTSILKWGASSNATLTTPHSQLNIHLAIMTLDLPYY